MPDRTELDAYEARLSFWIDNMERNAQHRLDHQDGPVELAERYAAGLRARVAELRAALELYQEFKATSAPPTPTRIDLVVVRDSDAPNLYFIFADGEMIPDGLVTGLYIWDIDPGAGGTGTPEAYREFEAGVLGELPGDVPPTVVDVMTEMVEGYKPGR